jgi:ABC-type glycerol-3-phosphate transport system substrate-binding protein
MIDDNRGESQATSTEMTGFETLPPAAITTDQGVLQTVRSFKVGQEKVEAPKKKWLWPAVAAGLVLMVLATWVIFQWQHAIYVASQVPTPTPIANYIVLNYWGLWEKDATLTEVLENFQAENPGVTVKYTKKNIEGYYQSLDEALSVVGQNAPDIFRYHATWRTDFDQYLAVLPTKYLSAEDYQKNFYPVVAQQLTDPEGKIKGIPLMYDSLALVYNRDLLARAGVEVPLNWPQFRLTAKILTVMNEETGRVIQAGAAMGLGENVDFATDIVGLLASQQLAQNSQALSDPDIKLLTDAITYYTSFYTNDETKTWDAHFDNSTQAFARGEVAMIFAPSWMIHDILRLNPTLPLAVAAAPQADPLRPVDWATYWVEGVNVTGAHQEAAWQLLTYLSRPEVMELLHREQGVSRNFGEIYPMMSMADRLAGNAYTQPYLQNARRAVGFPLSDKTFDRGTNYQLRQELLKGLATLTGNQRDRDSYSAARLAENWFDILTEAGYFPAPEK